MFTAVFVSRIFMNVIPDNGFRPEDILDEDQNTVDLGGLQGRKGSIAAFLKNIEVLEHPRANVSQKEGALNQLRTLLPVIVATGLTRHATFNNLIVQDEIARFGI